jgi:hypothetical protein
MNSGREGIVANLDHEAILSQLFHNCQILIAEIETHISRKICLIDLSA